MNADQKVELIMDFKKIQCSTLDVLITGQFSVCN